jgi:hypothetical protein
VGRVFLHVDGEGETIGSDCALRWCASGVIHWSTFWLDGTFNYRSDRTLQQPVFQDCASRVVRWSTCSLGGTLDCRFARELQQTVLQEAKIAICSSNANVSYPICICNIILLINHHRSSTSLKAATHNQYQFPYHRSLATLASHFRLFRQSSAPILSSTR